VLVTVCHLHPSLIFSNYGGIYSNEARFETPKTLGLTNTIAYYRAEMITTPKRLDYSLVKLITTVKMFIVEVPGMILEAFLETGLHFYEKKKLGQDGLV